MLSFCLLFVRLCTFVFPRQFFSVIFLTFRTHFETRLLAVTWEADQLREKYRKLNKDNPPSGYEMSIEEAWQEIANFYDAIELAEQGLRADFITIKGLKVVISACCEGDNPDAVVTVVPDEVKPELKLVK